MLEVLTGTGLAASAGLNAYIPLLLVGLTSRFTTLLELPKNWEWLSNEWILVILAVLLVIEVIADKIPAVDSVNDVIQTVVRPASGGLVFGSGTSAQTLAVQDPAAFIQSQQWVPIVIGIVIALGVHLLKMAARPAANAVTAGIAAPVLSSIEDVASLVMSLLAVIIPILVIVALILLGVGLVALIRRAARIRRRKAERPPHEGTAVLE